MYMGINLNAVQKVLARQIFNLFAPESTRVNLLIKQMIVVRKILGDFFYFKKLGPLKIAVAVLSQSEKISYM